MENTKTPLILLVEDDRSLVNIIENQLVKNNFEVIAVNNVEDALKTVETKKVDVIWLDHYLLGERNGLDFVVELKKEGSNFSAIPIFVVSNTATEEKVKSYMRLGVSEYYVKAEHSLGKIIMDIKNYIFKE